MQDLYNISPEWTYIIYILPTDLTKLSLQLKKSGVHIVTVGVGGWTDEAELNSIASYPHESNMIAVKSYASLQQFTQNILDIVCNGQ